MLRDIARLLCYALNTEGNNNTILILFACHAAAYAATRCCCRSLRLMLDVAPIFTSPLTPQHADFTAANSAHDYADTLIFLR